MKLIVACDPNGGIGYQNKLPWDKLQGDLPRFKALTMNKVIVMGRNTWESLPKKPLPGRINYVVTSDPYSIPMHVDGSKKTTEYIPYTASTEVVYTITMDALSHFNENACIIGGAALINSSWEYVDTIHLSRTLTEYTCDTFLDLVKLETEFTCEYKESHEDHTYEIWKRK